MDTFEVIRDHQDANGSVPDLTVNGHIRRDEPQEVSPAAAVVQKSLVVVESRQRV